MKSAPAISASQRRLAADLESPVGPTATSAARRLLVWFRHSARDLPWRRTRDPYAIWISEVMLQQTQVATVIPYFSRWMAALPDVRALAAARLERILQLWAGLGYYTRARNLHTAARQLVARHEGRLPRTLEGWMEQPGVGRYTAGALCSLAFNTPAPVVDGNVTRVLTRWRGIARPPAKAATRRTLWQLAQTLVDAATRVPDPAQRNCGDLNQALMELGAIICTPRQPRCDACPLYIDCTALREGRPHHYPLAGPRRSPEYRRWTVLVARRRGRFLVRQRPVGAVNGGLWEFPTVEDRSRTLAIRPSRSRALGPPVPHRSRAAAARTEIAGRFTLRHTITRYQLHVEVSALDDPDPALLARWGIRAGETSPRIRWLTPSEIEDLPLAALHRKILRRVTR